MESAIDRCWGNGIIYHLIRLRCLIITRSYITICTYLSFLLTIILKLLRTLYLTSWSEDATELLKVQRSQENRIYLTEFICLHSGKDHSWTHGNQMYSKRVPVTLMGEMHTDTHATPSILVMHIWLTVFTSWIYMTSWLNHHSTSFA